MLCEFIQHLEYLSRYWGAIVLLRAVCWLCWYCFDVMHQQKCEVICGMGIAVGTWASWQFEDTPQAWVMTAKAALRGRLRRWRHQMGMIGFILLLTVVLCGRREEAIQWIDLQNLLVWIASRRTRVVHRWQKRLRARTDWKAHKKKRKTLQAMNKGAEFRTEQEMIWVGMAINEIAEKIKAETLADGAQRRQRASFNQVERCMPLQYRDQDVEKRATRTADGWLFGNHRDAPAGGEEQLNALLRKHAKTAFGSDFTELPGYTGTIGKFSIKLNTDKPLREKPRRKSPVDLEAENNHFGPARDAGFIEKVPLDHPLRANYGYNNTTVAKKNEEGERVDTRTCSDARRVNDHTVKDEYIMPTAETTLRQVGGAKFFTSLDLKAGFNQIVMDEESRIYTAFHWNGDLWQWNRMTFGFRNASAFFQRVVDHELARAGAETFATVYVDDILIYSNTWEEHLEHIDRILTALSEVGLRCHPKKCLWAGETAHFLGFGIGYYGITPQEAKIKAIKDMPDPTNLSELRSQLGLINYYRHFLPHISARLALVRQRLKKGVEFKWTEAEIVELRELKEALCEPGLALKHLDPKRPIILHTDWSNYGIAGVLSQQDDDGKEYMVATCSRALNEAESRYSSFHGELLAVVFACRQFHLMLHGPKFQVVTDHKALTWLLQTKEHKNAMHMRWSMALQDYDFEIIHRMGVTHQNADVPSRCPVGGDRDFTGAQLDPVPSSPAKNLALVCAAWSREQVCASLYADLLANRDTQDLGEGGAEMRLDPTEIFSTMREWQDRAAMSLGRRVEDAEKAQRDVHGQPDSIDASSYGQGGLNVLELFGGIGAGLEMLLRSGVSIKN